MIIRAYLIYHFNALKIKGGSAGSPDGGDSDGELDINLTPRTEAKFNKIDEEFQIMMQQRNHANGNGSQNLQTGFSSMPVSVPICNESQFGSDSSSQHDLGHQGKDFLVAVIAKTSLKSEQC